MIDAYLTEVGRREQDAKLRELSERTGRSISQLVRDSGEVFGLGVSDSQEARKPGGRAVGLSRRRFVRYNAVEIRRGEGRVSNESREHTLVGYAGEDQAGC